MTIDTARDLDRRRAPRYAWVRPIEWETGTGLTCNMRSTTGLFFQTDLILVREIWLSFLLLREPFSEEISVSLHGRGQIVRISPRNGQWGVGLHFAHVRFSGPGGGTLAYDAGDLSSG